MAMNILNDAQGDKQSREDQRRSREAKEAKEREYQENLDKINDARERETGLNDQIQQANDQLEELRNEDPVPADFQDREATIVAMITTMTATRDADIAATAELQMVFDRVAEEKKLAE